MRLSPFAGLALVLAVSPLALADEGERKEPDAVERWIAFSRAFEKKLFDEHRAVEAVEEMTTQGHLLPTDAEPFCRAAYWALVAGSDLPELYLPGSTYYELTKQCIAMAVFRGAGPDEDGKGADPRITYALGRMRLVEGTYTGDRAARTDAMIAAAEFLADCLDAEPVTGFDREEVRPWYFRAAVNAAQGVLFRKEEERCRKLLDAAQERGRSHPDLSPVDLAFADIARAELHRALQEYAESERLYRGVIVALTDSPRGYLGLGRVLLDQGKHEESLTELEKAKDRTAGREMELRPEVLLTIANALVKLSPPRLEEAERALVEYFALSPDHPDGLYVKGLIAIEREDWTDARKYFRWVIRRVPDDTQARQQLVKVLYELGDEEGRVEAAKDLEDTLRRLREEKAAEKDQGTQEGEPGQAPDKEPAETPERND